MTKILFFIRSIIWGPPALILIIGIGIYLTLVTGFAQVKLFPAAVRRSFSHPADPSQKSGEISPFQALCTALAATVGTGNIVGVAGAICLGGPGAVFWMWICGFLGMITKYAESTLAVYFRVRTSNGYSGGPMYTISRGMGQRWYWLANLYCFFGIAASFGIGNLTQINAVVSAIRGVCCRKGIPWTIKTSFSAGIILAIIVGSAVLGGIQKIGKTTALLVPVVSVCYIILCLNLLFRRADHLPAAFHAIFEGAFSPKAVTGGALGSSFQALRTGCSRGVFSNEAGMGTASIAHASAQVSHPAAQGMMSILEVFLDTIVICTMTALMILCSGTEIPYGHDIGGKLTADALSCVYGESAELFLAIFLALFSLATVIGWGFYGGKLAEYIFGSQAFRKYAAAQTCITALGAIMESQNVWCLAEILNGLMILPNLISLAVLSPVLIYLSDDYINRMKYTNGGPYANFHQCKPLRAFSYAEVPPLCSGSRKKR